jgi:hypothetical protein
MKALLSRPLGGEIPLSSDHNQPGIGGLRRIQGLLLFPPRLVLRACSRGAPVAALLRHPDLSPVASHEGDFGARSSAACAVALPQWAPATDVSATIRGARI